MINSIVLKAGLMIAVNVHLTENEYNNLNEAFPKSMQSASVGRRAIELVKIYYKKKHPSCVFKMPEPGADLKISYSNNTEQIEIKGTEKPDISWSQIKVSSAQSYALLRTGMPLYRVVSVYERQPRIYIMKHQEDFEMVPEARWRVRPRRNT